MLDLSVSRHDGTPLDPEKEPTVLFYDEKLQIELKTHKPCEVHLFITIIGDLYDRQHQHSIVIHDENLPRGNQWIEKVHIRHPRSPLQNPHLEIVATARYPTEVDVAGGQNGGSVTIPSHKYLTPLQPIQSLRAGFLVPFTSESLFAASSDSANGTSSQIMPLTANGMGGHARSISTISAFEFAETYEKRMTSESNRSELVPTSSSRSSEEPESSSNGNAENGGGIEVFRWKAPLVQALELEIRSLRPALERDRVIAEIDLVAGAYGVLINVCDVSLDDGVADLMGPARAPIVLEPYDKYAVCYNLQLRTISQPNQLTASRKPLNLILECEILMHETNETTSSGKPSVRTVWMPIVDFEGTQGPLPKTPALHMNISSPMQSGPGFQALGGASGQHASHSSNVGTNNNNALGTTNSSSTLDLVSGSRTQSLTNLSLMGGMTIMISGPQFVKVGEIFDWSIKIMNRSQRHRMFTMTFGSLSRDIYKHDLSFNGDRMSSLSNYNADFLRRRSALQYRGGTSGRGIIPLCQELKVGQLSPHVCFETKIQLMALSTGTHTIEGAKVEDLTSRDSYDVGGLLEVIVEA